MYLQRTHENVFSRHGKSFSKWWYQHFFYKTAVQSDTYSVLSHENRNYTLALLRVDEFYEKSYKSNFIQLFGGKVHVQCDVNKIYLIISRQKKNVAVISDSSICVVV